MGLFPAHTWFGKAGKWIKNEGLKTVNNIAKTVGDLGIPLVSPAAKTIDALIPDKVVEKVTQAVQRDGFVDTKKIDETVAQYVPADQAKDAAKILTVAVSNNQDAPIIHNGAVKAPATEKKLIDLSISTGDKSESGNGAINLNELIKKPIFYIPVIGGIAYFLFFRNQKGGRRYGR